MKKVIETIVYAELASHEFVHVTTTDRHETGHAFFTDNERKAGKLRVHDCNEDESWFEPEQWNFAPKGLEAGVYHRSEVGVALLENFHEMPEAIVMPKNSGSVLAELL
jgi:hypothetical protein